MNSFPQSCRYVLVAACAYICMAGCNSDHRHMASKSKELLGTWVSPPVETEWGSLIQEFTFRDDGTIRFVLKEPDSDDKHVEEGRYRIEKGVIRTTLTKDEDGSRLTIKGDQLILQDLSADGQSVTFTKRSDKSSDSDRAK